MAFSLDYNETDIDLEIRMKGQEVFLINVKTVKSVSV